MRERLGNPLPRKVRRPLRNALFALILIASGGILQQKTGFMNPVTEKVDEVTLDTRRGLSDWLIDRGIDVRPPQSPIRIPRGTN